MAHVQERDSGAGPVRARSDSRCRARPCEPDSRGQQASPVRVRRSLVTSGALSGPRRLLAVPFLTLRPSPSRAAGLSSRGKETRAARCGGFAGAVAPRAGAASLRIDGSFRLEGPPPRSPAACCGAAAPGSGSRRRALSAPSIERLHTLPSMRGLPPTAAAHSPGFRSHSCARGGRLSQSECTRAQALSL